MKYITSLKRGYHDNINEVVIQDDDKIYTYKVADQYLYKILRTKPFDYLIFDNIASDTIIGVKLLKQ